MRNESDKQKLLILGTGSFAPEVAVLAHETGQLEVKAFVENWNPQKCEQTLGSRPILWIDEIVALASTHKAICALGTTHRQGFIDRVYAHGFTFITLVHPSVNIASETSIGEGSILSPGAIVAAYSSIGRHVLINRGCLIGHHTTIADYCTLSPGANIAASVQIDEGTYVGMGAIILNNIKIGAHSVIGAGAVVTRDVPDHVQVTGIPAKITKENIKGL